MPLSLPTIPAGTQIVERHGLITTFFRLLWQTLVTSFGLTPDRAVVQATTVAASVTTQVAYTTLAAGWYRLSYYLRKTVADGVSSSLTLTWGWTDHGASLSEAQSALTTDTTAAQQSGTKLLYADGSSGLTFAISYASNTPAKMTYDYGVVVEQMA